MSKPFYGSSGSRERIAYSANSILLIKWFPNDYVIVAYYRINQGGLYILLFNNGDRLTKMCLLSIGGVLCK